MPAVERVDAERGTVEPATRARRPLRRFVAVAGTLLLGVVGLLLATASPAAAHASVVATTPADGESVAAPPADFTVTFTESVDVKLGGLTVLDRDGDRVQTGDTVVEDGGRRLRVALRPDLADGTYVGTWRVVSADGHPISGSVLFAVGTPVDPTGLGGLTARTEPSWEVTGAVARFVTFTAALLAAGLGFFLAFLHDQRRDRWKLVPVLRAATLIGLVGVLATIAAQASLATGRGFGAVTDTEVLRTVLAESLGWSAVVLLAGLALVHLSTNTNRLLVAQGLAFYGWIAVSFSFVLWGHATEAPYRWLSVISDGVHAAAAALWFGGLVGLALLLRRRGAALAGDDDTALVEPADGQATADDDTGAPTGGPAGGQAVSTRPEVTVVASPRRALVASTATVLGRFSTAATASVVVLLAAGLAMTFIQTDASWTALWSTTYGRMVVVKGLLVVVVVAIGAHNRQRLVPRLTALAAPPAPGTEPDAHPDTDTDAHGARASAPGGHGDDEEAAVGWVSLRRNVGSELLFLVAALAVTAVLVNVTPARAAVEQTATTVELSAAAGDGTVQLTVEPARAGRNVLDVQYLDADGEPLDVANSLRVEFSLPDAELGPISREVVKTGPGSFVMQGAELSIPGAWQVTLVVRPSDFREVRSPFTVEVS
jgi:copper transport protein